MGAIHNIFRCKFETKEYPKIEKKYPKIEKNYLDGKNYLDENKSVDDWISF